MDVLLIRHGQSVGNAEGRMQGQLDYPLTEAGLQQARALAAWLGRQAISWQAAYVSPQIRALRTYQVLQEQLGAVEPQLDPDLRELHAGALEGMVREDIERSHPTFFERDVTHVGRFAGACGPSLGAHLCGSSCQWRLCHDLGSWRFSVSVDESGHLRAGASRGDLAVWQLLHQQGALSRPSRSLHGRGPMARAHRIDGGRSDGECQSILLRLRASGFGQRAELLDDVEVIEFGDAPIQRVVARCRSLLAACPPARKHTGAQRRIAIRSP
jgi:hypothetical protein